MEQAIRDEITACYARIHDLNDEIKILYSKKSSLEEERDAFYRPNDLHVRKEQLISREDKIRRELSRVTKEILAASEKDSRVKESLDKYAKRKQTIDEQITRIREEDNLCHQYQGLSFTYYSLLKELKEQREQLKEQREQLSILMLQQQGFSCMKIRLKNLNERVDIFMQQCSLKGEKRELEDQLNAIKLEIEKVSAEMEKEKDTRNVPCEDVTSLEGDVSDFNGIKVRIEGDLQSCIDAISNANEERATLFAELDELKTKLNEECG